MGEMRTKGPINPASCYGADEDGQDDGNARAEERKNGTGTCPR